METQSLKPREEIKQEHDHNTTGRAVRNFPFLRDYIKQELDITGRAVTNVPFLKEYLKKKLDSQTVKKEANGEKESKGSPDLRMSSTSSQFPSVPEENNFMYCEKCQLKFEGGCPQHGLDIYIDNAEDCQVEGYNQDSSPQVQVVDNKDRQVDANSYLHSLPKSQVTKQTIVPALTSFKSRRSGLRPILPRLAPYTIVPLPLTEIKQGNPTQHLQQQALQILQTPHQFFQLPLQVHKEQQIQESVNTSQQLSSSSLSSTQQINPRLQQIAPRLQPEQSSLTLYSKTFINCGSREGTFSTSGPNVWEMVSSKFDIHQRPEQLTSSSVNTSSQTGTFPSSSILQPMSIQIQPGNQSNAKKIVCSLKQHQDQNPLNKVTSSKKKEHSSRCNTGDTKVSKVRFINCGCEGTCPNGCKFFSSKFDIHQKPEQLTSSSVNTSSQTETFPSSSILQPMGIQVQPGNQSNAKKIVCSLKQQQDQNPLNKVTSSETKEHSSRCKTGDTKVSKVTFKYRGCEGSVSSSGPNGCEFVSSKFDIHQKPEQLTSSSVNTSSQTGTFPSSSILQPMDIQIQPGIQLNAKKIVFDLKQQDQNPLNKVTSNETKEHSSRCNTGDTKVSKVNFATSSISPDSAMTLSEASNPDKLKVGANTETAEKASPNAIGRNVCRNKQKNAPPCGTDQSKRTISSPISGNPSPLDFARFSSNLSSFPYSNPCIDSTTNLSNSQTDDENIHLSFKAGLTYKHLKVGANTETAEKASPNAIGRNVCTHIAPPCGTDQSKTTISSPISGNPSPLDFARFSSNLSSFPYSNPCTTNLSNSQTDDENIHLSFMAGLTYKHLKVGVNTKTAEKASPNAIGRNVCRNIAPPCGTDQSNQTISSPISGNPSPLDFARFSSNVSSFPYSSLSNGQTDDENILLSFMAGLTYKHH